jgi:tetratricopeptide (TPR) repeat protein
MSWTERRQAHQAGGENGVQAAKKAAELDPNSSEAHRLRGDLLGELIPHILAGGMRYGRESTSEIEKAIELNPNNVNPYIARAISYFYTPSAFGGSHERAVEMLKKAVILDATSDTAHIWLARVYLEDGKRNDARGEIYEALRLNPRLRPVRVQGADREGEEGEGTVARSRCGKGANRSARRN